VFPNSSDFGKYESREVDIVIPNSSETYESMAKFLIVRMTEFPCKAGTKCRKAKRERELNSRRNGYQPQIVLKEIAFHDCLDNWHFAFFPTWARITDDIGREIPIGGKANQK
jgi:hypothetical protein